jgi:hypothetical protein
LRDHRGDAAETTRSPLPASPSPSTILDSVVVLFDQLVAAHVQLVSSYLRIGSSVVRNVRLGTPAIPIGNERPNDEPASARKPSDPAPAPTELIAARAYQIFVRRGRGPGNPVDDWRQAEAEVRAETAG